MYLHVLGDLKKSMYVPIMYMHVLLNSALIEYSFIVYMGCMCGTGDV